MFLAASLLVAGRRKFKKSRGGELRSSCTIPLVINLPVENLFLTERSVFSNHLRALSEDKDFHRSVEWTQVSKYTMDACSDSFPIEQSHYFLVSI